MKRKDSLFANVGLFVALLLIGVYVIAECLNSPKLTVN